MGPGKYVYTREFTEDDNPKRFCRQDIVAQFRERVRYIIFLIDIINIDRLLDLINRQNQKRDFHSRRVFLKNFISYLLN